MLRSLLCRHFVPAATLVILNLAALAQTDGVAQVEVKLLDYNGSGAKHYTVVWVTTEAGVFVKSLRKQGPSSWTSSEWNNHCRAWNTARAGSTVLDGYTSATAASYSGTNSPVVCQWDGRDAASQLVADGKYKFWVQYAENSGQGPYTTDGLLWTKSASAATNTYPNQGANFADMRVTWTPVPPATVAPTITSAPPPPTGTVGVPYSFTCTATGTTPVTFTASGLPTGLAISPSGLISGVPNADGTFTGQITAANGTVPDATQTFAIVVSVVPTTITASTVGGNLVLIGTGPANGRYTILTSPDASSTLSQWSVVATGAFDVEGHFGFTHLINPDLSGLFYTVRVP